MFAAIRFVQEILKWPLPRVALIRPIDFSIIAPLYSTITVYV